MAMLQSLERPGDFESRRSSSADPNWQDGNGDCRGIAPGKTLTLAELDGPGRITHIWFTIAAQDKYYPRTMTLRMYWDGREEPSVESPIGDFFAVGHGIDTPLESFPVAVSSDGRARNCYWPMPFGKSAKITVTNDSDKNVDCLFWYIDWQKLPSLPEDTMYFHAQYRQEYPCKSGQDYLIFDGAGDGAYVGTVLSVVAAESSWFGEGDDRFYIDGATEPQLRGTGTEDYFCDAWGFRKFNMPFYGVSFWEGFEPDDRGTVYRWHIPDPIRFHKSLKVTIEHKGARLKPDGTMVSGFIERSDYFSTVAFWYQTGVAKRYATVPPASERLLPGKTIEAESLVGRMKTRGPKPIVQPGAWSSGAQVLWMNTDPKGELEVPFEVAEDGRYSLKLALTSSWDYGTFQIYLDGKPLGAARNLYSPAVVTSREKLGLHEFKKGEHVLKFVTVGSDGRSKLVTGGPGAFLGLDTIDLRRLPEVK